MISLPKTVTEIGHCAFALGMLTSVTIPNGVRIIGQQAFYDCAHMAEFPMPESLTSLGIYALAYCTGLTKITLPAGVTEIGKNAFSGATGLKEIWSYIKTPFTIVQKTFAVYEQATLYVPTGSKSLYQETEAWNMFQKIEEFNPTTGIVSMTLPASFDVYNVQGCRKLQHATSTASLSPGMYIINGRKFLKK